MKYLFLRRVILPEISSIEVQIQSNSLTCNVEFHVLRFCVRVSERHVTWFDYDRPSLGVLRNGNCQSRVGKARSTIINVGYGDQHFGRLHRTIVQRAGCVNSGKNIFSISRKTFLRNRNLSYHVRRLLTAIFSSRSFCTLKTFLTKFLHIRFVRKRFYCFHLVFTYSEYSGKCRDHI